MNISCTLSVAGGLSNKATEQAIETQVKYLSWAICFCLSNKATEQAIETQTSAPQRKLNPASLSNKATEQAIETIREPGRPYVFPGLSNKATEQAIETAFVDVFGFLPISSQ